MTSCGGTPGGCPQRGEIGIFNRSHYEEVLVVRVHPEILDRQKLPPEAQGQGRMGAPLPRDQRLGALPQRQRLHGREAASSTCRRRSSGPGSSSGSTCRRRTGSSRRPTRRSASDWDDYQKAFSEMLSEHQHALGAVVCHPGGPQVVRAHLRGRDHRPHADGDRPALPDGRRGAAQGSARGQASISRRRRPRVQPPTRSRPTSTPRRPEGRAGKDSRRKRSGTKHGGQP